MNETSGPCIIPARPDRRPGVDIWPRDLNRQTSDRGPKYFGQAALGNDTAVVLGNLSHREKQLTSGRPRMRSAGALPPQDVSGPFSSCFPLAGKRLMFAMLKVETEPDRFSKRRFLSLGLRFTGNICMHINKSVSQGLPLCLGGEFCSGWH